MEPTQVDQISSEDPIQLFLIKRDFDLDMNCLQIAKHYLYYEYENDKLRIHKFDRSKLTG